MESQQANGLAGQRTLYYPALPIFTRISYSAQLRAFKYFITILFSVSRFFQTKPASHKPTLVKAYPCRPRLKNRIFIPREHEGGELLPLYIDIHGGGYTILDPQYDDEFCSTLANRFKILVVSINYSKAPAFKFPVQTHDVAAITRAVIEDDKLPIDASRVAMGGFSAGGNLAFSAVQLPVMRDRIKAIVSIVPVLDFSISPEQKAKTWHKLDGKDRLSGIAHLVDYAYIPSGQDLKDPLLSTSFARKEDIPEFVFCIGADRDMYANEARTFMYELAGIDEPTEEEYEFERGPYKWTMFRDREHAFTHKNIRETDEPQRLKDLDKMVGDIGKWLFRGPFRQ